MLEDALNSVVNAIKGAFRAPGQSSPFMQKALLAGVFAFLSLKVWTWKSLRARKYISRLDHVGKVVQEGKESLETQGAPSYDFIVVGGGTAGCALAARLTEDPMVQVLVLEAGSSGQALFASRTPAAFSKLYFNKKYVHAFWTEAQEAIGGKSKFWPRAKLLGGCTTINAQMAQYGAPGDFDEWASIIDDDSWSWKNFSRYFRKFEHYTPRADFPNIDSSTRGNSGPVEVGFFHSETSSCQRFIQACMSIGIPFTPDFNGPHGTMGVGRIMTYISSKRERVSAETAYLTPDVLARPNLKVAINAHATRLLFDTSSAKPRAVGAEFTNTENGPRFVAQASKEVILCAGAVQSPHILMLSGVGPAEHLKGHSISVVVDSPGVGKHLLDHPIVDLYFKTKKEDMTVAFMDPKSLHHIFPFIFALLKYFVLNMGGPLAMNFVDSAAFVRSDDPVLFPPERFPEKLIDTTSAKDSPDLELFASPLAYRPHGLGKVESPSFGLHFYLLRPTSQGAIILKSNNPFAYPSVDPRYITTHEDVAKLVRGLHLCAKIAHLEPINSLLDHSCTNPEFDHQLHLKSNTELEKVVRERVETVYHPASTCRMAPREQGGVVDSKLRVYGVDGLRVCDASIFPSIISGHTTAGCYATAEKLADDIKADLASGKL